MFGKKQRHQMAKRPKLTIENLVALGPEELAKMLLIEAERNIVLKRQLSLTLSATEGPESLAKDVRKRINALARSRSFVEWHKISALENDLDQLSSAIIEKIAPVAPNLALDLMWRFLDISEATFERCDDSSGGIGDIFRQAVIDLGAIAEQTPQIQDVLVNAAISHLRNNGYGVYDDLITVMYPALSEAGVAKLKTELLAWYDDFKGTGESDDTREPFYQHRSFDLYAVNNALQQLADAEGDVDAFIATHDQRLLGNPVFAARIADRLISADRASEALSYLDNAVPDREFGRTEWHEAKIAAHIGLGQIAVAQALRWKMFLTTLNAGYLRSYLNELPDFDDFEAEDKALACVETHENVHHAVAFLVEWPAVERAARVIEKRHSEIDGDIYYILNTAADALEEKFPLAAVLLRRAMIEVTLTGAKSKRYKHAARHVLEIESLDGRVARYDPHETHQDFMKRLREKHARKHGFWGLLER